MVPPFLLPPSPDIQCTQLAVDEATRHVVISLATTAATVACPSCHMLTSRRHSQYRRTLADLPATAHTVQLDLNVRKFFCVNTACDRQIFTERLPALVAPFARRTLRLGGAQTQLGIALGGIAAARLSGHLQVPASKDTFLRLVRRVQVPPPVPPTIIGIDDWAIRKGHRYGSIVVDLERQTMIDLLPDRSSDTVAAWLQTHPSVQIISRDRAAAYAEGARCGAPTALQVADRFHLLQNLAETLRDVVRGYDAAVRIAFGPPAMPESGTVVPETRPPAPRILARRDQQRSQRLAQYDQIRSLRQRGMDLLTIAQQTGVSKRTIQRWLRTESFPERQPRATQASQLDPYKAYIIERWNAGCCNGSQLYRDIQTQGYPGKIGTVLTYCVQLRKAQGLTHQRQRPAGHACRTVPAPRAPSINQLVWLVMRPVHELTAEERQQRSRLATIHADLAHAITLAEQFLAMTRERAGDRLEAWLEAVDGSGNGPLRQFAAGLRRDQAAVAAGLTLPWSTGPVEGHINRLKTVKRQMYGRAKLDLLKQRLLAA